MRLRSLRKLCVILSLSALPSCATVVIHDSEWCGDMGTSGATCNTLNSGTTRDIDPDEWGRERFGQICGSSEAFTNMKASLMKLCILSKRCVFETKK